jgi:hypothetical protein
MEKDLSEANLREEILKPWEMLQKNFELIV